MKALIITHMYPSVASPLNGIFIQKQTEALVDAGVEAILIHPVPWIPPVFNWNRLFRLYSQIPRKESHRGTDIYYPRYLRFPRRWFFSSAPTRVYRSISLLVRRLIQDWRPDIIHAHVAHPCGAAAVKLGKEYGLPVAVTIHGMDFHYTLKYNNACERSVKNTLANADRVILVSETLKTNYGVDKWADNLDKYKTIYNGIHLEDIISPPPSYHKQSTNSLHAPVLLTVGSLIQRKGHAYILKSLPKLLQQFPQLTCRLAGDGEESRNLKHLAADLGVSSAIRFLGNLSHKETMMEMAACDLMLLPSWDEGFGIVYLEAMAHGKPVIGTKNEGAASLIENENVGLTVPARDAESIVHAVSEILSNHTLAHAMGKRGRDLVTSRFTWKHNAEQTIALYRDMLEGNQEF